MVIGNTYPSRLYRRVLVFTWNEKKNGAFVEITFFSQNQTSTVPQERTN